MDATDDGDVCRSFHSIIRSVDRDLQKSALQRRVSFHNIREVQRYNAQKECHEVAEEEMTSTESSGSMNQVMSTSIVTAMVSNATLADESVSFHNGPQAVSTPVHIPHSSRSRKPTPAASTQSLISLRSSLSTTTTNMTNATGHTTLKMFRDIEHQNNAVICSNSVPELISTEGLDAQNTSTAFLNCNDVASATPNVSDIFGHEMSYTCQSDSLKDTAKLSCCNSNDVTSNMKEKHVKQTECSSSDFIALKRNFNPIKNVMLRQFRTPESTPRRPPDQRKPPRRTVDRTWLVEFGEESELLADVDIDAFNTVDMASLDSTVLKSMDDHTDIEMASASLTQLELKDYSSEVCHSPCSKKSKLCFLIEQRPDSIEMHDNNKSGHAGDITTFERMEKSFRPIDASLIDSWIKAKQCETPHRAIRLSLPQSQVSFLSSVQDRDSSNSLNKSSNVSFMICNDEEFNMTVDESEKVCAEMKTLREIHTHKKLILSFLEMLMNKKKKLIEAESQLNIELSQAFQALCAKLEN